MKLKIIEVNPSTWVGDEYVEIEVINDCNLRNYAIFDKTFSGFGAETDIFRHIYFFGEEKVKRGDIIFLYSSVDNAKKQWKGPNRILTYYWNSEEPIWNDEKDQATLIEYAVEDTFSYNSRRKNQTKRIIDKLLED